MNSVFSAFKSNNKSNNASNSSETNNYEKLRHIREKMSNLVIDDDEISLRKPHNNIPLASIDLTRDMCDEYDSMLPPVKPKSTAVANKRNEFDDCTDSSLASPPALDGVNGSSISHDYANVTSLSNIKKHYNQDNSENYASENNLLSKCCNGNGMGSDYSIADASCDVNSSVNSLISIKSMPLCNSSTETSRSALTIYNKQPQSNNSARNRPRLTISNANSNSAVANQPAVHGRNNSNGLPVGQSRTRLSTHQRNLSLDFR